MSLLARRFPTIFGLLLIVGGIVAGLYYFQGRGNQSNLKIVPSKVRISNISDNKFSVSWTTTDSTSGSIEYGVVGEKLTNIAKDERDTEISGKYLTHHITVEGLQPSTQYAFRIISGDQQSRFDNNGSPYTSTTGPVIGATPTSQNFYGKVEHPSNMGADGAIVYLTLPEGSLSSTLVRESGNYAFTLSTIRTSDLRSFVKFDPSATVVNIMIESGAKQTNSAISLANSTPVPTITIGENKDFLNTATTPSVAEVVPGSAINNDSNNIVPEIPSIFNVEPLSTQGEINAVTTVVITILNPKEVGETLSTLRPEFRGTGPASATLTIALTGQKAISDTTQVGIDGTWSWAPVIDLKVGKQKVSVSYIASGGTAQKVEREFNISTSKTELAPAFVASPSASVATVKASTKPITPSATPRTAMPATDSGIPVTGVIENTLLTGGLGVVIMIVGATLLLL